MDIRHVIFDIDGTLWDAAQQVTEAWNLVLERYEETKGIRLTVSDMYRFMGHPMKTIAEMMMPGLPDAKQDEIMNVCMAEENDYLETHSGTFYPGVEKTFLQLKQEGYRLYIVSNCQDGYIQVMMKNGGLEKDITDFESNGRTGKFKADNIRLVLERNGIPKEAAVYVGDTPMDEIATREAGLRFIHAAYGYGKAEAPDAVIGSIKELPEALREMKEGGKF